MRITEKNFIKQLKHQNENALYYVIDNYGWILKTVIYKNLNTLPNLREECMNDCLIKIWENIDQFDPTRSEFKNWIAGIAKYRCIDYKRKYLKDLYNYDISEIDIIEENTTEKEILKREIKEEIDELLNVLSEKDKNIFIKFYFEDKNVIEISNEINLSENVIYKRLSRGRKKMKLKYEKGGIQNEK